MEDVETYKDGVRYKHVQEHHFDSTVKRMTVIYHDLEHRANIAFMKGAPERVLDACTYDSQGTPLTPDTKDEVLRLMDRFASEGLVPTSPRAPLISACPRISIQITQRRHPRPRPRRRPNDPPRPHWNLRPSPPGIPRRSPRMPTRRHRSPHANR